MLHDVRYAGAEASRRNRRRNVRGELDALKADALGDFRSRTQSPGAFNIRGSDVAAYAVAAGLRHRRKTPPPPPPPGRPTLYVDSRKAEQRPCGTATR